MKILDLQKGRETSQRNNRLKMSWDGLWNIPSQEAVQLFQLRNLERCARNFNANAYNSVTIKNLKLTRLG